MKVFRGKLVLTDAQSEIGPAIIAVKDGKIIEVLRGTTEIPYGHWANVDEVIDVGNRILMPGLVDSHVHVNEPGRTEWEGYETATKAGAASGITTIVDMPLNSIPPTTTVANFQTKLEAAKGKCFVDVAFWGGVVPRNKPDLKPLLAKGVKGFKCFLLESGVMEFPCVTLDQAKEALFELKDTNGVLLFHAELDIPPALTKVRGDLNKYSTFLESRPASMEDNAIRHIIELCRLTKTPCHIVHLGSGNSVRALEEAQKEGLPITAETCHHYLNLWAEIIPDASAEFKCCPPVRDHWHREELWKAIKKNVVSLVVSDHAPCTPDLKDTSKVSLMSAWGGISSVQFALPLMWTESKRRGFTLQDIIRLMSVGPAKLARLENRKGKIEVGYDADFVIWDPLAKFTVATKNIMHKNKLTPYIGQELFGVIHSTIVGGETVWHEGAISHPAKGKLLI